MDRSVDAFVKAHAAFKVKRQTVSYNYGDVSRLRETATYVLHNEGTDTVQVAPLPPRVMELQPDMTAVVDGGKRASILPSFEVRRRIIGHLTSSGISDEGRDAWIRLLQGGQQKPQGDEDFKEALETARNSLRAIEIEESRRDFYNFLLRKTEDGKYIPFIGLPEPVDPGEFVLVEFSRTRFESENTSLLGRLTGRHEVHQRFSIGARHSAHLTVEPPPGTQIIEREEPAHWPDGAGIQIREDTHWNVYLPLDEKDQIWDARDDADVDPDDDGWEANLTFSVPNQVYWISFFLILLLTILPKLLVNGSSTGDPTQVGSLIGLFVLVGGVYIPILVAHLDEPPVFGYLLKTGAIMAILALWWTGLAIWAPYAWDPLVLGGLAATVEAALALV